MKLLFLIHSLSSGGAERVTANLANHWSARGWQVAVVTLAPKDTDFYQLRPEVRRIALSLTGESPNFLSAIIQNLVRIRAVRRVLLQFDPDAAVALMSTANILLSIAKLGMNITAIGSERVHPPQLPLGQPWERLRKWCYGRLDAVVALTDKSAFWIRENTRARTVQVIPNPVVWPMMIQAPIVAPEAVLPDSAHILLSVGRLTTQKGFDILIDCFADLVDSFRDWLLVIIGEGSERVNLEEQIKRRGLAKRVLLTGRVGNLSQWYEAADIFVMSSRFEGFPNTLIEAMACGLPVVSVDCDTGPSDIIRHEVDGLLVPKGDEAAMRDALMRLMSEVELRVNFGKRAIEARDRFSITSTAEMWENLFREVKGND